MPSTGRSPVTHMHGPRDGCLAPLAQPSAMPGLGIRRLDMATERSLVEALRAYSPLETERDLDPSAHDLEVFKDRLGIVMGIWLDDVLIATIRFIPCRYGLTLAERPWAEVTRSKEGFCARSWEVGRLIVAPAHRGMATLRACLALALQELIRTSNVQYLHASCSPLMARLHRRFGFRTEKVFQSETGVQHVLIHARVNDVVRALGLVSRHQGRGLRDADVALSVADPDTGKSSAGPDGDHAMLREVLCEE